MTAAYTDDPTIAQEQKQDKRTLTTVRTTSSSSSEDNNEDAAPKVATGGQDKEEIDAEHERSARLSTSLEATEIEKKEKNPREHEALESTGCPELEKGQSSAATSIHEITREIDPTIEGRAEEMSMDLELDPTKPVFRDSSTPNELEETFEEEDRRNPTDARGADSSCWKTNNSGSLEDTNDASRIQLQEISNSIEAIKVGEKEASQERLEVRKSGEKSFERSFETISVEDAEENYDPESELNFHEAVRAGDAKCVAALLANGCVENLDEPDWNVSGDPPLLVAATNHCLPVLSTLLANGCDPAVRSPRGETALHRVILNGGPGNVFKFVGELLKYDCPPGVKEAGGGLTALHVLTRQLAHAQGSKNLHHNFEAALKTLELLAQAGPVNAKDHQGRSALHILASSTIFDNNHRTEIELLIETLLAAGADPSLKNDRGETPLHECLECGALNTAFLLVPHTPTGITSRYGETPLHIASRKNYVDMVAKLLERGEDPSVQDAGGNTPLHLASARGFHQTVSLLVTSPLAQLEKLNIEGLTALQVAAESGFVNAVRLLLKAGADPSQTKHYCTTTLHRHPDISVLIDHEMTRRRQLAA